MRALVIEDEAMVALLLQEALEDLGYDEISVAATEDEAVELARRHDPELVTADVRLARGSGVDAVLRIVARRPVPVVFVTGNAARVNERIGNATVLEKPFLSRDLGPAIERARRAPVDLTGPVR